MAHLEHELKLKILDLYEDGRYTQKELANRFKISDRTIKRWVQNKKNNKNLSRKERKYESYKLRSIHVKYAIKMLEKEPTITIPNLLNKLKIKFTDCNISIRHLTRVVRENNYTRKRTRIRHYPETRYRKPINLKTMMKTFYKETDKYFLNKIISIDETSIYAQMVSSYSRCKLGKRCVKKTKDNKVFIKFTLVCAINSKGVVGWTLYETGGMTGNRMSDFINKFIKNKYKNNLIIMDNGGAHKNECVKKTIEETNNSLLYSVPYRPKTNAIESWFSQFKHYFKHDETGINFPNLKKSVQKAIRKIPVKSYLNYIKYAYKNKDIRKFIEKPSTRRKTLKNYKL